MAKHNGKSGKQMRDERPYDKGLPAESAGGRMLNDDGSPANETGWQAREQGQPSTLKTKPKAPPVSSSNKTKKGNQPRI